MALQALVRSSVRHQVIGYLRWFLFFGIVVLSLGLHSDWYRGVVPAPITCKFKGDRYVYCERYDHLESVFDLEGWNLDDTRVPRMYVLRMPRDFPLIRDPDERKKLFLKIILPLALKVEEEIEEDAKLFEKVLNGELPPKAVSYLMEKYELDGLDQEAIELRVRPVPVWQVLAQTALESGWGTSRFVMHANNLTGEQVFEPGAGLIPNNRPKDANYEVRVFRSLIASLRRYINNLNTHESYKEYRLLRAKTTGIALLNGLKYYSVEREDYVEKLRYLVAHEGLLKYTTYTLEAPKVECGNT